MKILVISDTHGRDRRMERVLKRELPADQVIHCGDVEGRDGYLRRLVPGPCCIVGGNCDYDPKLPPSVAFNLAGHRFFVTHGHRQGVNFGMESLLRAARENQADIVCFGHTHRPVFEQQEGIWLCNPGSLTFPRQMGRAFTYLILEVDQNGVKGEIREAE